MVGIGEGIECRIGEFPVVWHIKGFVATACHDAFIEWLAAFSRFCLYLVKHTVKERSVCHTPFACHIFAIEVVLVGEFFKTRTNDIRLHIAIACIAAIIEMRVVVMLCQSPRQGWQRGADVRLVHDTHRGLCGQAAEDGDDGTVGAETVGIEVGEIDAFARITLQIWHHALDMSALLHDIFRETLQAYHYDIVVMRLCILAQSGARHTIEYLLRLAVIHKPVA